MAKPAVNWNNVSMLTPGMKNLGNQFNLRWPKRDGTSDGAIGDYQHTLEDSGHNPDDTSRHNAEWDSDSDKKPEIRAIDVDNNLGDPEVSMQNVIDHMRSLPGLSSVIRYMIYNKKIYKAADGFKPHVYAGASAHTEHAHFSGAYSDTSDENTRFDFQFDKLGDVDMSLDSTDVTKIWAAAFGSGDNRVTAGQLIGRTDAAVAGLVNAVAAIGEKVDLDPAEISALKAALQVPTAEENAQAVIASLGGVDTDTLVETLRSVLTPDQLAALKAAL